MCVGPAGTVTRASREAAFSGIEMPIRDQYSEEGIRRADEMQLRGIMALWQPTQWEDLRDNSGQMSF